MGKYKILAYRYCGPYQTLRRLGEQFYELNLPPNLHVHIVSHFNLIKKYIANLDHVLNLYETILVNQE